MPGLRILYVPPRLVGSLKNWSGKDSPGGKSWLVEKMKKENANATWHSPITPVTTVEKQKHGRGPVLTGSLYSAADHFAVDPEFSATDLGKPWKEYTEEEKKAAIALDNEHIRHYNEECRKAGIHSLADLVLNHVAPDNPVFEAEEDAIAKIRKIAQDNGRHMQVLYKKDGRISDDQNLAHHAPVVGVKLDTRGLDIPEELQSFLRPSEVPEGHSDFFFKFKRNPDLSRTIAGPADDLWVDVAHIQYESPAAREFFVTGTDDDKGYWKKLIDRYDDLGYSAFRCDYAFVIPPDVWEELQQYAVDKNLDVIHIGETLGADSRMIERMGDTEVEIDGEKHKGWNLGMLGYYWWDYMDGWLPGQHHQDNERATTHGSAGCPDNHDTSDTIPGGLRKLFGEGEDADRKIATATIRDYAVSALCSNSHYWQLGMEYCKETQNDVFKGCSSPEEYAKLQKDRGDEKHILNIEREISRINALKEAMDIDNCRVSFKSIDQVNENLVKLHVEYYSREDGANKGEMVLLVNRKPENGPAFFDQTGMTASDGRALSRLALGEGDVKHPHAVSNVMILHTPAPGLGKFDSDFKKTRLSRAYRRAHELRADREERKKTYSSKFNATARRRKVKRSGRYANQPRPGF